MNQSSGNTVSGRWLVVAMFTLGFTATGLLFLYWNLHLLPYMPLQEAIVAEFEDSAPRVEGGKRKLHNEDSPMLLRIVMRVPYDPTVEDTPTRIKLDATVDRLKELAREKIPVDAFREFQLMEVHLYHPIREKEIRELTIESQLTASADVDQQLLPVKDQETPPGK
ncbi:MAG: hypothetical protein R3C20_07055 [Planctomycetaceae bacterium]